MAAYHISVLPYNSGHRSHLKFQVRVRHPDGKIERSFFKTRAEALSEETARRVEIENVGIDALSIDARTRLEVISALGKLKPFEVSISQAADFFVEHHRANCTVKEACDLYLAGRKSKSWSTLHRRNLKSIVHRFVASFGERSISTVKVEDIEKWFDDLGVAPVSVNSYRGLLNSVFAFAKKRKLTKTNPFEDIDPLKIVRDKVGILTPSQLRRLLEAASDQPDVLITVALGAFAGIRPEEVARLRWESIDLQHGQIDCPATITKTAKHRYVKIEPVLRAWLEFGGFSSNGADRNGSFSGLIQGDNFRRRFRRVRWFGGFQAPGVLVLKPNASGQESATPEELAAFTAELGPWPHDCLRHSYASYHFAKFRNPMALAAEMGHETTKLIFSTYRERVKPVDADAWWSLLPKGKP